MPLIAYFGHYFTKKGNMVGNDSYAVQQATLPNRYKNSCKWLKLQIAVSKWSRAFYTQQNAENKPTQGEKQKTFSFYVAYYIIKIIKPHCGRAVEKLEHFTLCLSRGHSLRGMYHIGKSQITWKGLGQLPVTLQNQYSICFHWHLGETDLQHLNPN